MEKDKSHSWEDAVRWLKSQPAQQELVRACFYDDPLLDAAARYWSSTEWKAVQKLLPPNKGKALDIGAGRGISSYALARDGWTVTALEPNPSAMVGAGAIRGLAAQAGFDIAIAETWGEQLPFEDDVFDVVHCRQVLHHARDLGQLCREIGRVLKPGGCFIATREHVISRKEDLPVFLDRHPLHKFYGGENAFLLQEYEEAIKNADIVLTRTFNPAQSDINLFPETKSAVKRRMAARLHLPAALVPDFYLAWRGSRDNTPGRIYTFVGHAK